MGCRRILLTVGLVLFLFLISHKNLFGFYTFIIEVISINFRDGSLFVGVIFASLIVLAIVYAVLNLIYKINHRNPNYWVWGMFGGMIFFFLLGLVFLQTTFGVQTLNLKIWDKEGNIVGILNCDSDDHRLLVGSEIRCKLVDYPLSNSNSTFWFKQRNGSTIEIWNPGFKFIAPVDVVKMKATIEATTIQNKTIVLESGAPYTFLTIEEDKQRQEKFIVMFLGLLGLVIFTVPSLVINLRKIFKHS